VFEGIAPTRTAGKEKGIRSSDGRGLCTCSLSSNGRNWKLNGLLKITSHATKEGERKAEDRWPAAKWLRELALYPASTAESQKSCFGQFHSLPASSAPGRQLGRAREFQQAWSEVFRE